MDEPRSKKDTDEANTNVEQRQNECKNITISMQSTLSALKTPIKIWIRNSLQFYGKIRIKMMKQSSKQLLEKKKERNIKGFSTPVFYEIPPKVINVSQFKGPRSNGRRDTCVSEPRFSWERL